MIKPGEYCKRKDLTTGEYLSDLLYVYEVRDDQVLVCEERWRHGEFCWRYEIPVSELEPGEMIWRPFAEWISGHIRVTGERTYHCSHCGECSSEDGMDNFCSHCGAKMRKEQSGDKCYE